MSFLYQSTGRYFAVCGEGLEELVATELARLGASETSITRRGVHFIADPTTTTRIVLASRLVGRVLAPLASFDCHSEKYLHRRAVQMPWEDLLTPDHTLAVSATLANSKLSHTQYVSQVLKDAVVDRLREKTGRRPSVDRRTPHLRLHVHVQAGKATVSADVGDGSRHRRGYRTEAGAAPLQESLAAAVLEFAGWEGDKPLLDPMCGSGTLLAEAVLRACRVPTAFAMQTCGALRLPDFGPQLVRETRAALESEIRALPEGCIRGSDRDRDVLAVARENLTRVPHGDEVRLRAVDFRDHPGLEDGLIVCNPPYGVRLGDPTRAQASMRDFGDFLKHRCKGSECWMIVGDRELLKHVGLRTSRKVPVRIGGLDGRIVKYEMY